MALRRAGLLEAERGPLGGYRLAQPPSGIAARDIVEAVDGPVDILDCVHDPAACERAAGCAARDLWQQVDDAIISVLEKTTLADLRERHLVAQGATAVCYEI
ncbi:MAG: Rrf2 family transcriptional regulator [Armatimonadota bacterium]|nr:MAG: Rrf2 family transcriptional regulator [Armatimonadota bacterium]